jgi:hypothetical protein
LTAYEEVLMDADKAATDAADVEPAGPPVRASTDEPDDREREPGDDRPDGASKGSEGEPGPAHRVLKLVLTLRPADSAGYHALIAVGSDDCDPLLRSVDVADLPGALQEVAALVTEAEARWQTLPRNPTPAKKSSGPVARRSGPKQLAAEGQSDEPEEQNQDAEQPQSGQLTLFG